MDDRQTRRSEPDPKQAGRPRRQTTTDADHFHDHGDQPERRQLPHHDDGQAEHEGEQFHRGHRLRDRDASWRPHSQGEHRPRDSKQT